MIYINGHSNFNIKIIFINNEYLIIKYAKNKKDFERLIKQIEKQELFKSNLYFSKPKITLIDNNNFNFVMKYISGIDIYNHIINSSKNKNIIFFNKIIYLIDTFIKDSPEQLIDKNIIKDKLNSIQNNIKFNDKINVNFNDLFNLLEKYINTVEIYLPVGKCHGDLTFSNMIYDFDNDIIYLIDFLDSFIETPLFDIIKIRQDTKYQWSLNLVNFEYNYITISVYLDLFDNIIHNYYKNYNFYNHYYFFQIINLLRVLQYTKDIKIMNYLIKNINQLKNDFKLSELRDKLIATADG
jgi:tRNA A-37 threonylcarbamoyl transferase component Bud32